MADKLMSNTFEFIGTISPCKETDKFKPYETMRYNNSDWGNKHIKFNAVCGNNRHLVEVSALVNVADPDSMTIYTYGKSGVDNDGNKFKGENLRIPFKDRFKEDIISQVAEYRKFVVDTELPSRRFQLEKAIDKFKDGSITDEQMNNLDVHSLEECEKAYAESKKKHHEFISAYDFIDFLNKFVNNEKIKNMKFKITGTYELTYNEKSDIWYRSLSVQRIYRQNDDAEITSAATFGFVFDENAVDDNDFDETKKIHINGYIGQYLNNYKKFCFSPMTLTIDGNGSDTNYKKALGFKKKFVFSPEDDDHKYREIGLVCNMLNGSQEVELTEDMLSDEQRENLEFGLITMEDIKKELGKPVFGDRVQDIVIDKLARGYSGGSKPTAYTEKDFAKPHIESETTDTADDDEEDIFNEDDLDI